jgi:outer membrane protein assembly factor BamB
MVSIPGVTDDAVVIGTTDAMDVASIVALDAASGHERWRVATDAYGAILSPLVAGGRVVVPVYDLAGGTGLLSLGSPG